jgi:hypothetical protein
MYIYVHLYITRFIDIHQGQNLNYELLFKKGLLPDKAKLFARRGRKATGLQSQDGRAAEGSSFGVLGFFIA